MLSNFGRGELATKYLDAEYVGVFSLLQVSATKIQYQKLFGPQNICNQPLATKGRPKYFIRGMLWRPNSEHFAIKFLTAEGEIFCSTNFFFSQ